MSILGEWAHGVLTYNRSCLALPMHQRLGHSRAVFFVAVPPLSSAPLRLNRIDDGKILDPSYTRFTTRWYNGLIV
jgi:hypothetical protein